MRINYQYGTKERLFEVLKRVNNINEAKLPVERKAVIIADFMRFIDNKLGLNGDMPEIKVSYDSEVAQQMKSFGKYTPETNELLVVIANRNLADVLRTLAHELVHHKQRLDNKLDTDSNKDGSEVENEANSLAAVFMREYGKNNPIIFE
jgi:Zn-dependent peptidase ImmA (M78 family)